MSFVNQRDFLSQWEKDNNVVGLLQQILDALTSSTPILVIDTPVIVNIPVSGANTPTPIGPLQVRWAIIQNVSTDAIAVTSNSKDTVGIKLNPASAAGQGGGSVPLSPPRPGELIDLTNIFFSGPSASDSVSLIYFQ